MADDTPLKVTVTADALFQVLSALQGPGYLIRELQVVARLPGDNPLSTLAREYNDAVIAFKNFSDLERDGCSCNRDDVVEFQFNDKLVGVDRCIAPLVEALNSACIPTVASCCGHGIRPGDIRLADGRALMVFHNRQAVDTVEALFEPLSRESDREKLEDHSP